MGEIFMVLFKVGDLDITPFIVAGSYAVSSQPEYDTWYDGNRTERRGIKRWKLKGSFNVKFMNANDYRSFLSALQEALTIQGYVEATVYNNKTRTITNEPIPVFVDFEPPNIEPLAGREDNEEINVRVTER